MRTITKEVRDKNKAVVATIEVQQADSFDECIKLAGSNEAAIEVFNRHWVIMQQNAARPGRVPTGGTGARAAMEAMKKLSPEVQALLKGRSTDEIASLLEAAAKKLAKQQG